MLYFYKNQSSIAYLHHKKDGAYRKIPAVISFIPYCEDKRTF